MKKKLFPIAFALSIVFQAYSQEVTFSIDELIGRPKTTYPKNLLPVVYDAFTKMQKDAFKQNIEIQLVSGFRSFDRQMLIFKKKYNKYRKQGLSETETLNKIIEYSTIPGTSRHHWGTDIDIVQKVNKMPKNLLSEYNYESEGPFCRMKEWMDKNAAKYGFYLVYTNDKNRKGFKYEPWHYSYAPVSKKLLQQFLAEDTINNIYPKIVESGVEIEANFYKNYVKTHVKGIDYQLLIP